ncbi:fasciclin domain family protein [Stemphylium lycopersici]|uniref:FAS1 domain-containing protein n=1 Tax=Stemphylium lycopersici TaxID=183478 RepID=A0A364N1V6_STELY|nr:fasciclin domain family protein [Stemphylium lycopersici]RAR09484.1 FAS1 domain-containing protein [Stemphylium lycopersici]
MRFSRVVPVLPLASALVITEPEVFSNIEKSGRQLIDNAHNAFDNAQSVLDDAFNKVKDGAKDAYSHIRHAGLDIESWLEGAQFDDSVIDFEEPHHSHDRPHHGKPHEPPHHDKPNRTVYELINESKYTTKLAKLINEYDDIVQLLNGTAANYTVFAPTDEAFEKIPEHHHKPSKEVLKDILLYHVVDDFYPAGRVLKSYTIPTLYTPSKNLGHAQRLTPRVTIKGPAINFYSRLIALNIFGTNGVVHGVSSILVPPPNVATIIDLLPGDFSTLELGLGKTGLFDKINNTDFEHNGGTFFTPSNFAFQKLGPRANAFLFSKYGEKYLRALLEYHMVVDQTLYSDAFFDGTKGDKAADGHPPYYHYDLPTVLSDKYLAVDVACYGPFVSIRINGFSRVTVHDGVASDGVIQVVSDVLIPPKNPGGEQIFWQGEELEVEDLKERLQPFIENIEL